MEETGSLEEAHSGGELDRIILLWEALSEDHGIGPELQDTIWKMVTWRHGDLYGWNGRGLELVSKVEAGLQDYRDLLDLPEEDGV